MSAAAQEVYLAEQLQWEKDQWDLCGRENEAEIKCIKADELRSALETARAADGYYAMDADDREDWDEAYVETAATELTTLTAAWITANAPAAKAEGGACSATSACTESTHCCATTATPPSSSGLDALTNICGSSSTKKYTNEIGIEYTLVCPVSSAKALVASAATLIASAYLM